MLANAQPAEVTEEAKKAGHALALKAARKTADTTPKAEASKQTFLQKEKNRRNRNR